MTSMTRAARTSTDGALADRARWNQSAVSSPMVSGTVIAVISRVHYHRMRDHWPDLGDAAVDRQQHAGYEAGRIAGEKGNCLGYVPGIAFNPKRPNLAPSFAQ